MNDLVYAALMTAAIPGLVVGLLSSIRSGPLMTLMGGIVGLLGGVAGGMALPGLLNFLGVGVPEGPISVAAGSVVGALVLLLVTANLRLSPSA